MMSRLSPAAAVLLAALLMAPVAAAQDRAAAGEHFKPFKLKTPEGTHKTLSDVLGKATLVVFFFPTCGYCNVAFPEIQKLHDAYKDRGLSMVWINVIPQQERLIADWRRRHGYTVPILLGGRSVQKDYRLTMTPTHYLIDAAGKVLWRHAGYTLGDEKDLERRIQEALAAQAPVSFSTQDGGFIHAHVYGTGDRGVVLAHGGRFNKESWEKQAQALAAAGFRVLALDFRGYGESRGPGQSDIFTAPLHFDVLAAVRHLRMTGVKTVSLIGASLGGGAVAQAVIDQPGEIDRLVLLAALPDVPPEKLGGRKLFIIARDDADGAGPRLPRIRALYAKAPEPKQLIIVEGSAHAQFLFQTDQGERVMREIVRFLSAP